MRLFASSHSQLHPSFELLHDYNLAPDLIVLGLEVVAQGSCLTISIFPGVPNVVVEPRNGHCDSHEKNLPDNKLIINSPT